MPIFRSNSLPAKLQGVQPLLGFEALELQQQEAVFFFQALYMTKRRPLNPETLLVHVEKSRQLEFFAW